MGGAGARGYCVTPADRRQLRARASGAWGWAWALGDPASFLAQLADAGLKAHVETETLEFAFDDFASAWDVLAGVTASQLEPERAEAAKAAVRKTMWPNGDGWRRFRNETHFIIGHRIG